MRHRGRCPFTLIDFIPILVRETPKQSTEHYIPLYQLGQTLAVNSRDTSRTCSKTESSPRQPWLRCKFVQPGNPGVWVDKCNAQPAQPSPWATPKGAVLNIKYRMICPGRCGSSCICHPDPDPDPDGKRNKPNCRPSPGKSWLLVTYEVGGC